MRFYLDEKDFVNIKKFDDLPELTTEALILEPSDFKKGTKISKIEIYPNWETYPKQDG